MAKLKKGQKLVCVPCGREIIIDCCGVSETTIWCCGKPMRKRLYRSKRQGKTA